MLTTDLVRVVRRSGRLYVPSLKDAQRARLAPVADGYARAAAAHAGRTREELSRALDEVGYDARDHRVVKGLRKLLLDRCTFEARREVDPPGIRREVFRTAALMRASLEDGQRFDRAAALARAAAALGVSAKGAERDLFADLKQNHVLVRFDPIDGPSLLDAYETAGRQAVLLRAVTVKVTLRCRDAESYRRFFRALKFRRLLHTIHRLDGGSYRIEMDGPFSLFRSVTKYGLQLALMLPELERSGRFELDAEVMWDKGAAPLLFHLEGGAPVGVLGPPRLPDEVAGLARGFAALDTPWSVDVAHEVLDLPGEGVCVPDLVFRHARGGDPVYLEVLGYWSREAVWKRVDLVRAGLPYRIVFAVSSRLRVSEQVLDDDLPGQLYVYKGVMRPRAVADILRTLEPPPT